MKTILIIEDDENLSRGITFALQKDGYTVLCTGNLRDGTALFHNGGISLIILDIGLPDGSGIQFCKDIRERSTVPVIMLTARDLETDEVSGLLAGADDYITKPFSLSVLRVRVETVLRRTDTKSNVLCSGIFQLDISSHNFFKGREEISLSSTEFKLLHYFMTNAGQVLTKEQILSNLWDSDGNFVDENTLSVNISRLRAKIEDDPKKPKAIRTVHGIGYIWSKE
ncbi:MAG: response regulator transcription factor [Eubacteriales bacterium]